MSMDTLIKFGSAIVLINLVWLVYEIFKNKEELISLKVALIQALGWLFILMIKSVWM